MAKRSAKKRPPVRRCPRGAEDNNLIRERLDACHEPMHDSRRSQLFRSVQSTSLSTADRSVVRRIEQPSWPPDPDADPATWTVNLSRRFAAEEGG